MLPLIEIVVPVKLPIIVPSILPPDMLAVVVMLLVELIADTTFELKLNPAAFKLPLIILPVADSNPPVRMLPPVTFALTDTVVPVCVVALTLAPPKIFPPVILPVADINPPVNKLPPVMLPLMLRLDATSVPTILPAVTLPVVEKSPVPTIPTVFTLPVELINAPTTDPPADTTPAAITLAPVTLPPALTIPVTDCVPVTCWPLVVKITMFDTPATDTVALPPEDGI